MFQIPSAGSVYLDQKPINIRWGACCRRRETESSLSKSTARN
jgi:hypothetical protein